MGLKRCITAAGILELSFDLYSISPGLGLNERDMPCKNIGKDNKVFHKLWIYLTRSLMPLSILDLNIYLDYFHNHLRIHFLPHSRCNVILYWT